MVFGRSPKGKQKMWRRKQHLSIPRQSLPLQQLRNLQQGVDRVSVVPLRRLRPRVPKGWKLVRKQKRKPDRKPLQKEKPRKRRPGQLARPEEPKGKQSPQRTRMKTIQKLKAPNRQKERTPQRLSNPEPMLRERRKQRARPKEPERVRETRMSRMKMERMMCPLWKKVLKNPGKRMKRPSGGETWYQNSISMMRTLVQKH